MVELNCCVNNFNSYYKKQKSLIDAGKPSIILASGAACKFKKIHQVKTQFDQATDKIKQDVKTWKSSKSSESKIFEFKYSESEKTEIKKHAKRWKIAKKVCFVAAVILLSITGLGFLGVPFWAMTGAAVSGAVIKIYPIFLSVGVASAILGTPLLCISLSDVRAIRKNRLATSENFQEFVKTYVAKDNSQINLSEKDLLDPKIHKIYKRFKFTVKKLQKYERDII